MKQEFKFYRHWFAAIKIKNLLPIFRYSKNVQGWFFTRNYTLELFTYAVNYSITIISDIDIDRSLSHDMNVAKYIRR